MKQKFLSFIILSFCGWNSFSAGLSYDFESSDSDWSGRGEGTTVELSSDQHHNGEKSLYVSNRTQSWHGAALQNSYIEAGKTYIISAYVFSKQNTKLNLSVQYSVDDSDSYPCVKESDVYAYSWTQLSGEIVIPEDAENIQPYIQAPNDAELSFYIDDVTCKEKEEILVDFSQQKSLKALFTDYFLVGTAVTASEISPKNAKNMVLHHFNSITPGNELKPDCLLDQGASISEGNNVNPQVKLAATTKTVLKFCSENNLPIRGHVFIWHSQTPDWFFNENFETNGKTVTADVIEQRMENYIKNVISLVTTSYPNLKIYAWDIVNEAFTDKGTMREKGSNYVDEGKSRWMEIYNDNSFIYKAFEIARKYIPTNCKIYYNDYNEYVDAKRDAIYALVKDLFNKGLCNGIGMQSHLSTSFPSVSLYKTALEKYCTIGCDVQITELDITLADGASFDTQANMYKELFDLYKANKDHISSVTFWGINDEISWRKNGKPLIFSNYEPKPAYNKITENMELPTDVNETVTLTAPYITADHQQVTIHCQGNFTYSAYSLNGKVLTSGNGTDEKSIRLTEEIQLITITSATGETKSFKIVNK